MSPLYLALHRWALTPHAWSECDCMTTLADWVLEVRGVDPAADLRGTYGDPAVCPVGRRYARDPLRVCGPAFMACGLIEADPVAGDIGLVVWPGERWISGALCLGRQWASKTEGRGVLTGRPVQVISAWGVGYAA